MASATLTDGTVIKWEGELAVGTAILVETAEGDIPAPDGTHEVEGGTLVTTVGGVVTEIVEPTQEVVDMTVDKAKELMSKQEFAADLNQVAAVLKYIFDDMYGWRIEQDAKEAKLSELSSIVQQFEIVKKENESLREAFSKTVDLVEKVANLPSAEPTKAPEVLSKKEQQFANIVKIAQQLKNK